MLKSVLVVSLIGVLLAFVALPRSLHRIDESGKIIIDGEFLRNPGTPFVVTILSTLLSPFSRLLFPLEFDSLIHQARQITNLNDFYPEEAYWKEGLAQLLYSLNNEVDDLTLLGRASAERLILEGLVAQLQVQSFVDTHPSVLKEELIGPLVLGGLPRTGSTHMQGLLCGSERVNCLLYYQTKFPVGEEGVAVGSEADSRVHEAGKMQWIISYLRPLFLHMHVSVLESFVYIMEA